MYRFSQLDKFKNDLNNYKSAVEKITNPRYKTLAEHYLDKFKYYGRLIDSLHDTASDGRVDLRGNKENIKELVEVRVKLDAILNDTKSFNSD
jgi:hypothetical protein